jgi:hypothetical protein
LKLTVSCSDNIEQLKIVAAEPSPDDPTSISAVEETQPESPEKQDKPEKAGNNSSKNNLVLESFFIAFSSR